MGPIKEFKAGAVRGAIFENQRQKEGENFTVFSTKIERRYQDLNGKWQSTNSFRTADLPKVELISRKAYEFLSLKEKSADDWENNSEEKKDGMESSFPQ